jgi:pyruvate/2-oxoglutarate dehydrogenase complex dihydrolipoamide acyltransferase (E2) component
MVYQIRLPGPIEHVEEYCVLEWHRAENQSFAVGDLLVEIETQKSIVEVRAAAVGVLRRILCKVGQWQELGNPIALVSESADEPVPETVASGMPSLDLEFDVI